VVEADLQRYYGIDLRDLWRGGLSLRRVRVLLDHLPSESHWATMLRAHAPAKPMSKPDMSAVPWSTTHELLATLVDSTREVAWTLTAVNAKKKPKPPAPFPRPGVKPRRRPISPENRARIQGWIDSPHRRR
jgi:hypothetical protein